MEVSIHVVAARRLLSADSNGLSDPYVSIQLIDEQRQQICQPKKTQTQKKTLEPDWDEVVGFATGTAALTRSYHLLY